MGGFNTRQFQEMLENAQKQAQDLQQKMKQTIVEASSGGGTVTSVMDYGAFVDIGGVDGLLHISEMSHRRVKNLKPEVYVKRSPLVQRQKLSAVMQCYGIASTFGILT